ERQQRLVAGEVPGRERHLVRGRAATQRLDHERGRRRVAVREGDERVPAVVGNERHAVGALDRLTGGERVKAAGESAGGAELAVQEAAVPRRVRPEGDLREPLRV